MQARNKLTNEELSAKADALIASFDQDTNLIDGEKYATLTDQINRINHLKNQNIFDELAAAINEYEISLAKFQHKTELPVMNAEDEEIEIDPKIYDYLENEASEIATETEKVETLSLLTLISGTDRHLYLGYLKPKITEIRNVLLDTQALLDEHLKRFYEDVSVEAKLKAEKLEQHLARTRKHLGIIQKSEENVEECRDKQTKFGYFNTPEIPEDRPIFCSLKEAEKKLEDYFKREESLTNSFNISCANEKKFNGLPIYLTKISKDANVRFTASTFKNDKKELNRYAMISYYEPQLEVFSAQVYLQNLPKNKRIKSGFLFNTVSIPNEEIMIQAHDIVENVRFANIYNPQATPNYTLNESLRHIGEAIELYCKLQNYNDFNIYGINNLNTTPHQVALLQQTMGDKFKEMLHTRLKVVETQFKA